MSDVPKRLRFSDSGRKRVLAIAKSLAREKSGREDRYKGYLANRTGIHRHTIARCLDQGEVCNFDTVDKICVALDLRWEDVCDPSSYLYENGRSSSRPSRPNRSAQPSPQSSRMDRLVQEVRQAVTKRIRQECGSVRMSRHHLPIDQLVEPNLYTISSLPSEQFKSSALLTGEVDESNFDRMGILPQYETQVDGKKILTEYQRLLVYASPGCGKTSYLKWLATQCSQGHFLPNCVPIFLSMRAFAPQALHKNLYTFIEDYLTGCGVRNVELISQTLFQEGRVFLLLDGLDEVPGVVRETVDRHVAEILNRSFHSYYVFSCRLALSLGFADDFQKTVIALFSGKQRALYVKRWFQASATEPNMERKFSDRLRRHVNFGELTRTPLLLDLLCRVFQDHDTFPNTRAGVYDWGLGSLLKEESRKLRTNSTLSQLTIDSTRALLQKIAADFFLLPQPQTLFERKEVERKIREFFQSNLQLETSPPSARKVIEDIEVTYGLMIQQAVNYCSFSHLTFQEYFTAEYLVKRNQYAVVHERITDPQWRFVIELVAELLPREHTADFFRGYQRALVHLIQSNGKIQIFLRWIDSMAIAVLPEVNTRRRHPLTLLRAWYFVFTLENPMTSQNIGQVSPQFEFPDFDYATSVIRSKTLDLHRLFYQAYHATLAEPMADGTRPDQALDDLADSLTTAASRSSYRVREPSGRYDANGFIRLVQSIYLAVRHDPALENHIAGWQDMIRIQLQSHTIPQDWWHHRRQFWHAKVESFMRSRYDLRCQWNFTDSEKSLLRAYYNATKLLSICMNRSQCISPNLHQSLAENLLLSAPEIPIDDGD